MSTVCVLTAMVIGSWPMIASAVAGVASAMGFTVAAPEQVDERVKRHRSVETDVPNSEILEDLVERGETIRIQRDDVLVVFGRDERGACTVCVSGDRHSKRELTQIGEEIAGRLVQQFAYHKLMTELKKRRYDVVEESVQQDDSIQVRVKLNA
jgi:hypothetical protein